jgi:HEAT repeat protein
MAKGRGVSALYDRLAALRREGATAEARAVVAEGLKNKSHVIVEKAAGMAADFKFSDLCGEISETFARFMCDPGYDDRGCGAKTALARAAVDLKCAAESLFLTGIRHFESGGGYDPAAELRQLCALGLVQTRHPEVMNELVRLLVDPIVQARIGAVRALAQTGREEAALVLRLKVLMGDIEADVIAEAFLALMELSAERQVDFVSSYLSSTDEQIHAGAALAIGAARRPKAFDVLREWFERNREQKQPQVLLAMATCRIPAAIDYLMGLVKSERFGVDAVAALALYKHDPALAARVKTAAIDCGLEMVKSAYSKHFGADA